MKKLVSLIAFFLLPLTLHAAPVDVNSADAQMLAASLQGVGPKVASAIVEYRKRHGPYKTVDDLLNVKGIGPKTLEKNKSDILLNKQVESKK